MRSERGKREGAVGALSAKGMSGPDGSCGVPGVDDDVSPVFDQWPYLRFLGLGIWWAWIWLCYSSVEIMGLFPEAVRGPHVAQMYFFSTASIALTVAASALFWKRATRLVDSAWGVIAAGAVAAAATLTLAYSGSAGQGADVLFGVAAAVSGVATGALCLKVGRVYGTVNLGDALVSGALSLVLAALLYFCGLGVPEQWRLIFIALLPVASALVLSLNPHDPYAASVAPPDDPMAMTPEVGHLFRKLVAASAFIAFTAGVGKGISSMQSSSAQFSFDGAVTIMCIAVLGVVIAALANRDYATKRGTRLVYTALMVLGIGMMLATCFGLPVIYLSIGKETLWLVLSCLMAYMAFRFELSSVRAFGIGQAVYYLGSTAGWAVGAVVAPHYADGMVRMGVGMGMAFLIVLVLVYVFTEQDIKQILELSSARDAADRETMAALASASASASTAEAKETVAGRAVASDAGLAGAKAGAGAAPGESLAAMAGVGAEAEAVSGGGAATTAIAGVESGGGEGSASGTDAETPAEADSEPALRPDRAADPIYGLSKRELEVMMLFARGRSANWIADHLVLSKNTVRTHLRSVYAKLDVHTRQELLDFLMGESSNSWL